MNISKSLSFEKKKEEKNPGDYDTKVFGERDTFTQRRDVIHQREIPLSLPIFDALLYYQKRDVREIFSELDKFIWSPRRMSTVEREKILTKNKPLK